MTARGAFSGPVDALAAMVRACSTFAALAGVRGTTLAQCRAFGAKAADLQRPFALVNLKDGAQEASGARMFIPRNNLQVYLELPAEWNVSVISQSYNHPPYFWMWLHTGLVGLPANFFQDWKLKIIGDETQTEYTVVGNDTAGVIYMSSDFPMIDPGTDVVLSLPVDELLMHAMNIAGDIVEELKAQSGTGGCLFLKSLRVNDYGLPPAEAGGGFVAVNIDVEAC